MKIIHFTSPRKHWIAQKKSDYGVRTGFKQKKIIINKLNFTLKTYFIPQRKKTTAAYALAPNKKQNYQTKTDVGFKT